EALSALRAFQDGRVELRAAARTGGRLGEDQAAAGTFDVPFPEALAAGRAGTRRLCGIVQLGDLGPGTGRFRLPGVIEVPRVDEGDPTIGAPLHPDLILASTPRAQLDR